MKKLFTVILVAGTYLCSAQQAFYDVSAGNGNGIRFWEQDDWYKIHMGTGSEYFYGPVTDYSIKTNMSGGYPGRGWTWGVAGQVPVAAINISGNMQIAGGFTVGGDIVLPSVYGNKQIYTWSGGDANWRIGMSASPGFSTSMATSHVQYLSYWSSPGQGFAVGVNGGQSSFEITGSNHNAFFRGNVGVGTTSPLNGLHVYSLNNSSNGSIRFGYSGTNDGLLSLGYNPSTGRDALKLSYFPHNSSSGQTDLMTFDINGNVGIGTVSPSAKLNIYNSGPTQVIVGNPSTGSGGFTSLLYGTSADSNGYGYLQVIQSSGTALGNIILNKDGGNVGIGTTSPDAKLAVAGQVHAQEVKVSVTVPGPDFVFEKDYKLTSLEDIKNYIDQNKHLPEVPSAKEMEKNGVQLGEMNMLLLKKIEELTLYTIEMNEKMNDLKNENETAKAQMKIMQAEINQLKK